MFWFRRILRFILGLVLILSLFGLAVGTSLGSAFQSPNHLESWISSSGFYSSLISKAVTDTNSSLGNAKLSAQLNPIVKQSLENVYSKSELNKNIDTIISNNYAWLQGKVSKPNFNIDVSSQKNAFAIDLGNYVETQYQKLPKCTSAELSQLSVTNPLDLTCQVPNITPAQIKSAIVNDVNSSNIIVKNTVITPASIKRNNGQPYYTVFNVPAAYRHLKYEPILATIIALICIAGIIFSSARKRKSIRIIGFCFAFTGLMLLISGVTSNSVSSRLSSHISRGQSFSSFITPIYNLSRQAVHYINSVNLWFGVGYLLIAVALLMWPLVRRRKGTVKKNPATPINTAPREIENSTNLNKPTTTNQHGVQPTAPVVRRKPNNRRLIQ